MVCPFGINPLFRLLFLQDKLIGRLRFYSVCHTDIHMFSAESAVSNVSSSNVATALPDLTASAVDLSVAQNYQTQDLSDDAVTRVRTAGKAMDDFRVALADTSGAVFARTGNSGKRTASKPAGFQPGLIAACSFGRPGAEYTRDIDNTALDSTHGLKKHKLAHDESAHGQQKPYQCLVCAKTFGRKDHFKRHEMLHTDRPSFVCDKCGVSFSCKGNLDRHQRTHHDSGALYQCDKCTLGFLAHAQLMRHKQWCHSVIRSYECDQCHKTFGRKSLLDQHQTVHVNERSFSCSCGSSYKSYRSLKLHKKLKHPDCTVFNDSHGLEKHQLAHNQRKFYQCSVCSRIFADQCNLDSHKIIHTDEQPFLCDNCGCCFEREKSFIHHKKHHCDGVYKCDECHRCFLTDTMLRIHKQFHDSTRFYRCKIGDPEFTRQTACSIHMNDYHNKELPHECEEGGQTFKTRTLLTQHKAMFFDGKNFFCVSCGASYKCMDLFRRHMMKKHPDMRYETRLTNTADAVISQSPLVIDHPSTSGACRNDSRTAERRNKLFDAPNRIFSGHGEFERSGRFCMDNSSASATSTGAVVDIDETNEHKKQEITVDYPGKRKHGMSESLEEQTINRGAVISQLPSVIDQPSTSATNIDLMDEEDLDKVFDDYLNDICSADGASGRLNKFDIDDSSDSATNETSKYKKITVDSYGKHEQGMSEPLAKQTADAGAVVSQSPFVMDDLLSEKYLEELVYRYTRDLLDGNDGLFNESGEPDNDTLSD